ncbi:ABC transporter substrate-binding protein [Ectothiorhodospira mobilis]|uniref:ABC transporter substrate-binding protein n=1 Tax=Ectothiorhodospira mobilis TaxID=195064 RepID=UPI001EE8D166|nr:ABC transporter substrate-binding protein [Ectothiorhodospira mobilis]MCG5536559.1 ABC transporter substrate-binding protein [Ectothiorhodospira mobilis]
MLLCLSLLLLPALAWGGEEAREPGGDHVAAATHTVRDMLGRQVRVPKEIRRIATVNVDAFRMLLHLQAEDRIVGIPSDMFGSRFSRDPTLEALAFERLEDTPRVGGGQPGSEIDLEGVIATDPDLFILWSFSHRGDTRAMARQADRIQERLGIPVIALNTLGMEPNAEEAQATLRRAYRLLGRLLQREERARQILARYEDTVEHIQDRIRDLPAPRVYLAHRKNLLQTVPFYLPLAQLGLENVAAEGNDFRDEISAEHLLHWAPEHIFLHTPSRVSRVDRESLLDDPTLRHVPAVANGRIHRFKGTYMGWDPATGLIDLMHMAKILFPRAMADVDVAQRGERILRFFYGEQGLYAHLARQSGLELRTRP